MPKLEPNYEAGLNDELAGLEARIAALGDDDPRTAGYKRQVTEIQKQLKDGRPAPAAEKRPAKSAAEKRPA